ncbi:MAG TPA: hypothetical protein VE954_34870 [Oligoflexus sp.]|uniref:hypothetical protein n=1 Tax=Oligoflexus sp. TaxID=1971216 RepID=UPI002D624DA8|nr:hypothetical protein [Oligoflexus sp.]HYX38314.1 hypothetical protein [Oligoflexus sp.]
MKNHAAFILALAVLLLSCSRLQNDVHKTRIVCGREPTVTEKFLSIDNATEIEALLLSRNGSQITLERTDKGCIILPAAATGDLYLRDKKASQLGLTLRVEDLGAGLSFREFENADPLVQPMLRIQCNPTNIVNDAVPIRIQSSDERKAQLPFAEVQLSDRQQNIIFTKQIALHNGIKNIPLDLKEGSFSLSIRNFDAFMPEAKEPPQRCEFSVDRDKPSVKIIPPMSLTQARPGQAIDLAFTDSSPTQVFVCAKRRDDESVPAAACAETDYINTSTYVAPEEGMWDLSYFAVDAAGNRSSQHKQAVAVFHSDIIDQIKLLSQQFNAYMDNEQKFEGFNAYQKLVHLAKRLTLKSELREVYWKLLGNFRRLSKSSLRWRQKITDEGSMEDLELFGSVADNFYLIVNPNNKQLDIFENYQRTSLKMDLESVIYLGKNRFLLLEQGKRIDVYQGSIRERSLPFPADFEYIIGTDAKESMLAIANERQLRFIDLMQTNRDREFDISMIDPLVIPLFSQLQFSADGREVQLLDGPNSLRIDLVSGRKELTLMNDCPYDGLLIRPLDKPCKRDSIQDFLAETSRHQDLVPQEIALPIDPNFPYLAMTTITRSGGTLFIFDLRDPKILPFETSADSLTKIQKHPKIPHSLQVIQGNVFENFDLGTLVVKQSGSVKSLAHEPDLYFRQFSTASNIRSWLAAEDDNEIALITSDDSLEIHANADAHKDLRLHPNVCGVGSCLFDKASHTRIDYSDRTREMVWHDEDNELKRTWTSPVPLKAYFIYDKDTVFLIAQDKSVLQWQPRTGDNVVIGSLPFLPEKFDVNSRLETVTFVSQTHNRDFISPYASFMRKAGSSWVIDPRVFKGDTTGAGHPSRLMLSRLDGRHSALDVYDLKFNLTKTLPIQYKLGVTACVKDNVFFYHENSKSNIIHRIDLRTLEFMPDVTYPEEYRYEFCENEGSVLLRKKTNGTSRVNLFALDLQSGSIQSRPFAPLQLLGVDGKVIDADNETFWVSPDTFIFADEFSGFYVEWDSEPGFYLKRFEVHPEWFDAQIRKSPLYKPLIDIDGN